MAHSNWDAEVSLTSKVKSLAFALTVLLQDRVHRSFLAKYVIPGTKNMIKNQTLYQVGREVQLVGSLVNFDPETLTPIVLVSQALG